MRVSICLFLSLLTSTLLSQEWENVVSLPANSPVYQIQCFSNTNIYISSQYYHFYKWNGSIWSSVGDFDSPFNTVFQVNSENDIYATCNRFLNGNGTTNYNYLSHWNGNDWSSVGTLKTRQPIGNFKVINPNEIYAVGAINELPGFTWKSVAKYNGTNWSVVGTSNYGTYSNSESLWVNDANDIYAKHDGNSDTGIKRVKHWDGTNWNVYYNFAQDQINGCHKIIYVSPTEIYTWGFSTANSTLASLAKWNGTYWEIIGNMQQDMNTSNFYGFIDDFIYVSPNEIYAVGSALRETGIYSYQVARWNGTNWEKVGNLNGNYPARVLHMDENRHLYTSGEFTQNNKTLIKRFDTNTFLNTNELPKNENVKIYPNPTFDKCFFDKKYDKIYLFDTNGKLLETQEQIAEINLSHYKKGVYYIKLINSEKKIETKKIIKK